MENAGSIMALLIVLILVLIVFRASGAFADWVEAKAEEASERARRLRLKNDILEKQADKPGA